MKIKVIHPEDYPKVSELAGKGLNRKNIAAYFDMSLTSFERRLSESEDLRMALEKGRAKTIETVANVAYDMAVSGNHPAMTMFWLKCRANWREKKLEDYIPEDSKVEVKFIKSPEVIEVLE